MGQVSGGFNGPAWLATNCMTFTTLPQSPFSKSVAIFGVPARFRRRSVVKIMSANLPYLLGLLLPGEG